MSEIVMDGATPVELSKKPTRNAHKVFGPKPTMDSATLTPQGKQAQTGWSDTKKGEVVSPSATKVELERADTETPVDEGPQSSAPKAWPNRK